MNILEEYKDEIHEGSIKNKNIPSKEKKENLVVGKLLGNYFVSEYVNERPDYADVTISLKRRVSFKEESENTKMTKNIEEKMGAYQSKFVKNIGKWRKRNDGKEDLYINPWGFIKLMGLIAYESIISPLTSSYADFNTGEIVRKRENF